jgi:hypothetical protein
VSKGSRIGRSPNQYVPVIAYEMMKARGSLETCSCFVCDAFQPVEGAISKIRGTGERGEGGPAASGHGIGKSSSSFGHVHEGSTVSGGGHYELMKMRIDRITA